MDWGTFDAMTPPEGAGETQWESMPEDDPMKPDTEQFERLDENIEVDWGVLDNLDLETSVGTEQTGEEGMHYFIYIRPHFKKAQARTIDRREPDSSTGMGHAKSTEKEPVKPAQSAQPSPKGRVRRLFDIADEDPAENCPDPLATLLQQWKEGGVEVSAAPSYFIENHLLRMKGLYNEILKIQRSTAHLRAVLGSQYAALRMSLYARSYVQEERERFGPQ